MGKIANSILADGIRQTLNKLNKQLKHAEDAGLEFELYLWPWSVTEHKDKYASRTVDVIFKHEQVEGGG